MFHVKHTKSEQATNLLFFVSRETNNYSIVKLFHVKQKYVTLCVSRETLQYFFMKPIEKHIKICYTKGNQKTTEVYI